MRPLYGVCIPIFACPGPSLFRTPGFASFDASAAMKFGKLADRLGYDSVWIADHLMLGLDEAILEGWTTLSALAGATERVRLGMIHMAHYYRHPALAAKMAATVDQLSGGRLINFMDIGYQRREYVNYGLLWKDSVDERAADLAEAIELVTKLWTAEGPLTYAGNLWHVSDAILEPKPLQKPYPPLWFGEDNPHVLDLCARYGSGWNTVPASIDMLRERMALLREACERQHRAMDEITISLETQLLIAPDLTSLRESLRELIELGGDQFHLPDEIAPYVRPYAKDPSTLAFVNGDTDALPEPMASDWIIGTPEQVRARIDAYIEEGVGHFMFWFMDAPSSRGVELMAETLNLPASAS